MWFMVSRRINPACTAEHTLLRIDDPRRVGAVTRRTGKLQPPPSTASANAHLAIEHFGDWGENAHVSHV
jgi:hypothetical protein